MARDPLPALRSSAVACAPLEEVRWFATVSLVLRVVHGSSDHAHGVRKPALMLRCPFCEQVVDGLTLFGFAGVIRVLVCVTCYDSLVLAQHQPRSRPMRRLRRLAGLIEREVMVDEGLIESRNGSCVDREPAPVTRRNM